MDATFAQHYSQVIDALNHLLGHAGVIEVGNHLSLGGNRIQDLGEPVNATDAVSSASAQKKYSPGALKPSFEAGGDTPFSSYRQINNRQQREQGSSFLNDLMSTPPSANAIHPIITNGVGSVTVDIPASVFTFADGSNLLLQARTDILNLPAQFAISSISASGEVVSVVAAATGLSAGEVATIVGVTPSDFDGTFTLISSSGGGANLEYQDNIPDGAGSGGFVQENGVYYYSVGKRSNVIRLNGPFAGDTLQNRLQVSDDGYQIVAVIVITNSGGQMSQSGGGGSPITGSPTAGSLF